MVPARLILYSVLACIPSEGCTLKSVFGGEGGHGGRPWPGKRLDAAGPRARLMNRVHRTFSRSSTLRTANESDQSLPLVQHGCCCFQTAGEEGQHDVARGELQLICKLDCRHRPQLRGPCQGAQERHPQGAVLLLEADVELSVFRRKD